jgi:hypothetical protein
MKNKLIILLLCFCAAPVFGQEVVFNVSPRDAFVRINGEVFDLSGQKKVRLTPGTYQAEIWAPGFEVKTKSIEVKAGKTEIVNFGLKTKAQPFEDYQEVLSEYKTAKLKRSLSGATLIAANAGLSYFMFISQYRTGKKAEDKIEELQELYDTNTSFIGFGFIQEEYSKALVEHEEIKRKHDRRTKIGIPVVAALTAATAYLFYRRAKDRKLKKPVYTPKNPFVSVLQRTEPLIVVTENRSSVGFALKF